MKERFTRTAEQFAKFSLAKRSAEAEKLVALAMPHVRDAARARALDVACGPGTFTLALAKRVARVAGLDVTPAFLEQARAAAAAQGIANVKFVLGQAERLPWPAGEFDLVTCAYSLHHMSDPAVALAEMRRVLKTGGCLGVVDLIVPPGGDADAHNVIERARDSSHATSVSAVELRAQVERAGLRVVAEETGERVRSFDDWMRIMGAERGEPAYAETRRLMEATFAEDSAGFHARPLPDGDIEFVQVSYFVVGKA